MNVHFHSRVSKDESPEQSARSGVVLGVSGTGTQSSYTNQKKPRKRMIVKRPALAGDAKTIREEMTQRQHHDLVEHTDPVAPAKVARVPQVAPYLRAVMTRRVYERVQSQVIPDTGATVREHLPTLPGKISENE